MNKKDKTRELRQALGSFPTGVTVVTCLDSNNNPLGFTANSFTSVSLEPQLISICIDKDSFNIESFSIVGHFAVSVLSEDQQAISTTFATPNEDRFLDIEWDSKNTGSPIIPSNKYNPTVNSPILYPNETPKNKTTKVCIVIGTG